jgi:hypothetical protein
VTFRQHKSVRQSLQASFIGPVVLALLFGGGINAFVKALNEPLKVLLILFVNRLIRQGNLDVIPLEPPRVWWGGTVDTSITALGLVVLSIVLGLWLYPKSRADC